MSARAYEQLAASIRDAILDGGFVEGERLPSEAAFAKKAGVSRSTLREALRLLQEAGFLERVSPKILVVRRPTEEPAVRAMSSALRGRVVTFQALYESLMLLEPELSRLAALRCEQSDLDALRRILDEQHRCARDFGAWCKLDEEFHMTIATASANAPLTLARATLGRIIVPTVAQLVDTERATSAATSFHDRLYAEISVGDSELAALIARRHIEDFRAAWERAGLAFDLDISGLVEARPAGATTVPAVP